MCGEFVVDCVVVVVFCVVVFRVEKHANFFNFILGILSRDGLGLLDLVEDCAGGCGGVKGTRNGAADY